MSMPKIATKQETLDFVKNKLEENPQFKVLEQVPYDLKPTAFPNLKTLSFIFYKDNTDDRYRIARTENMKIEFLTMEDFNTFDKSRITDKSMEKINELVQGITFLNLRVDAKEKYFKKQPPVGGDITDIMQKIREQSIPKKSSDENKP